MNFTWMTSWKRRDYTEVRWHWISWFRFRYSCSEYLVISWRQVSNKQEAHRPRRIKYSTCCPVGGEVPSPSRYPPARSDEGVPKVGYPSPIGVPPSQVWRGYPRLGTPRPGLMGGTRGAVPSPPHRGTPARSNGGLPKVGYPRQGYPPLDLTGVPPIWLDLAGVPLPPRCEQAENITFPRTTYSVGNNIAF